MCEYCFFENHSFLGRKDFEEVLDGMCDKKTTLFVPSNAVSAYKEAPGWKSFIVRQMKNYNYGMGCSTNWIKA